MGMNSVSVVGPRSVERETKQEKVSDLDKVLQGVQLASGILGIGVSIESIKDHRASTEKSTYELDQSKAANERKLKGIYLPEDIGKAQTTNKVSQTPATDSLKVSDTTGQTWYLSPQDKQAAKPDYVQVDTVNAQGQPVTKTVERVPGAEYVKPQAAAKSGVRIDEGGISSGGRMAESKPQKPATESQSKAALFGKRMVQAEEVFSDLEKGGYDRASIQQGISNKLPGVMQGKEIQMQTQAEDNFLSAVLRKESGAVIGKQERADGEVQYFPRAGDSPEVIEQKRQNRALAIAGMAQEGGTAFENIKMPEKRTVSTQGAGEARAQPSRGRQKSPKDGKWYIETAPNAWQLDPNQGE